MAAKVHVYLSDTGKIIFSLSLQTPQGSRHVGVMETAHHPDFFCYVKDDGDDGWVAPILRLPEPTLGYR